MATKFGGLLSQGLGSSPYPLPEDEWALPSLVSPAPPVVLDLGPDFYDLEPAPEPLEALPPIPERLPEPTREPAAPEPVATVEEPEERRRRPTVNVVEVDDAPPPPPPELREAPSVVLTPPTTAETMRNASAAARRARTSEEATAAANAEPVTRDRVREITADEERFQERLAALINVGRPLTAAQIMAAANNLSQNDFGGRYSNQVTAAEARQISTYLRSAYSHPEVRAGRASVPWISVDWSRPVERADAEEAVQAATREDGTINRQLIEDPYLNRPLPALLANVAGGFRQQAGGAFAAIPEVVASVVAGATGTVGVGQSIRQGMEPVAQWFRENGQAYADPGRMQRQIAQPFERGTPEYLVFNMATSLANMAPAVATGTPTMAASLIGAQVFGEEYDQNIERGLDPQRAAGVAALRAIAEFIPERMALGVAMGASGRLVPRTARGAGAEAAQEGVTQLINIGLDIGVFGRETTFTEALDEIAEAMVIGSGPGGAIAAATGGRGERVGRLAQALQQRGAIREMQNVPFAQTPDEVARNVSDPELRRGAVQPPRVTVETAPRSEPVATMDDLVKEGNEITGLSAPVATVEEPPARREQPRQQTREPADLGTGEPQRFLVMPGRITSRIGPRRAVRTRNGQMSSSNHPGVDIAAPEGRPIPAGADGEVIYAGPRGGYGNTVILRHSDGSTSRYAHQSRIARGIEVGDRVQRGQTIGYVGQSGNATGPHLHLERRDAEGNTFDPLSGRPVRGNAEFEEDLDPTEVEYVEDESPAPWEEEEEAPSNIEDIEAEEEAETEGPTEDEVEEYEADEEGQPTGPLLGYRNERTGEFRPVEPAPEAAQEPVGAREEAERSPTPTTPEPQTRSEAIVELSASGRQIIVRGASPEQVAAIREATGSTAVPRRDGSIALPPRHLETVEAIIQSAPAAPQLPPEQTVAEPEGVPRPSPAPIEQIVEIGNDQDRQGAVAGIGSPRAPIAGASAGGGEAARGVGVAEGREGVAADRAAVATPTENVVASDLGYSLATTPEAGTSSEIARRVERYEEKLFDLEVDGTKSGARAFAKRLVKDGVIPQSELDALEPVFKDRDVGVEDITSELRTSIQLWEEGQRTTGMKLSAAAEPMSVGQRVVFNAPVGAETRVGEPYIVEARGPDGITLRSARDNRQATISNWQARYAIGQGSVAIQEDTGDGQADRGTGAGDGVSGLGGRGRDAGTGRPDDRGAEPLTGLPVNPDGTVTLDHWSVEPRLTGTDPGQWGRAGRFLPEEERRRIGRAPGRTYFGIGTGRPGGYVNEFRSGTDALGGAPRYRYEARIPAERLYDMEGDPDGLKARGREMERLPNRNFVWPGKPDGVDGVSLYELLIQDAGYAGYWIRRLGMVAAIFEPVPVRAYEQLNVVSRTEREAKFRQIAEATEEALDEVARMGLKGRKDFNLTVVGSIFGDPSIAGGYSREQFLVKIAAFHSPDARQTTRHEVMHWALDRVFNPAEAKILLNWAKNNKEMMAWARGFYGERGLTEDEIVEEALAEGFSHITSGRLGSLAEAPSGKVAELLERLADLFRKLWIALTERGITRRDVRLAAELMLDLRNGEAVARADDRRGVPQQFVTEDTEALDKFSRTAAQASVLGDPTIPDPGLARRAFVAILKPLDAIASGIRPKDSSLSAKEPLFAQLKDAVAQKYTFIERTQKKAAQRRGLDRLPEREDVMQRAAADERAYKLDLIHDQFVEPMVRIMVENGLTKNDVGMYLYARHAPHRNARIARINKEFDDPNDPLKAGSGMADPEAQQIISDFRASGHFDALDQIAQLHDAMIQWAQDERLRSGLLNGADVANGFRPDEFYTPLRGNWELDPEHEVTMPAASGGAAGFSVRGKESPEMKGRASRADPDAILAQAIVQAGQAADRAWRNEVADALYRQALNNPDPGFWRVDKVDRVAVRDKATGMVRYEMRTRLTPQEQERTVFVKVDGVLHKITFEATNPTAMRYVRAAKNLDVEQLKGLTAVAGMYSRFFSRINTQLNADFVAMNMVRDMPTGLLNSLSVDQPRLTREIAKNLGSFKAIVHAFRGGFRKTGKGAGSQNPWTDAYERFRAAGGKIGFNQMAPLDDALVELDKEIKFQSRSMANPMRWARATGQFISRLNDGAENVTRLAAFKAMIDLGVSDKEAARVARELTVNFTQHGRWGPRVNAWYAFANATTIGNVRMAITLAAKPSVVAGLVILGALQHMLMSAFDEDWEEYSEEDKARWFILPTDGMIGWDISIPMPPGYNALVTVGRKMAELATDHVDRDGHRTTPWNAAVDSALALGAWSPITGQSIYNFLSPTAGDTLVDVVRNENYFGNPVAPPSEYRHGPASYDHFRTTPSYWVELAQAINGIDGNRVQSGTLDVSPDQLRYVVQQAALGGAGRSVERLINVATGNNDQGLEGWPVIRGFVAAPTVGASQEAREVSLFYDRYRETQRIVDEAKELRSRRIPDYQPFREENRAVLTTFGNKGEGAERTPLQQIDLSMRRLSRALNAAEDAAGSDGVLLTRDKARAIERGTRVEGREGTGLRFPVGRRLSEEQLNQVRERVDANRQRIARRFNERYEQSVVRREPRPQAAAGAR